MRPQVHVVDVFPAGPGGGNPAPVVLDAGAMDDAQMQAVARETGHESAFVVPPPPGSGADLGLRFWVPGHEMSMCGHATVGTVWLLDSLGALPGDEVTVWTPSGLVSARVAGPPGRREVEISQPAGVVEPVDAELVPAVADVLGLPPDRLGPVQNAATSRVKTLVPVGDGATLDGLTPDLDRVEALCDRLGSTGLYPYAVADRAARVVDARQFPRSSGYPEDPATGIAAAALAFGLLAAGVVAADERPVTVRQGRAMGRPSEIRVRFEVRGGRATRCWLGGPVTLAR